MDWVVEETVKAEDFTAAPGPVASGSTSALRSQFAVRSRCRARLDRSVAIVSDPRDAHAVAVREQLLRRHGVDPVLLDFSRFPTQLVIESSFGSVESHFLTDNRGHGIDLATLASVWWRRPAPPAVDPAIEDPAARNFAYSECTAALYGVLRCLGCRWINDLDADAAAGRKPYQLQEARSVGLEVPDTLITNDPAAAWEFYEGHGRSVVYKSFLATRDAWAETRFLREDDLTKIAALRFAPVIFQELVDGPLDLRITIIGDHVYAAAFDISQSRYPYDVRLDLNVPCFPYELDEVVCRRLVQLTRALGLVYGAVDMRLDADGCPKFLEINPAGQFLYVEEMTGLPISAAVADELASTEAACDES